MRIFLYNDGEGQKKGGLYFLEDALGRVFPGRKPGLFKDEKGKPHTDNPSVFVSVSHCKTAAACAVSDRPVGIDIEGRDRKVRPEKISERFFTDEERLFVEAGGDEAFLEVWVRKEAWSKLEGSGISYGLKNIQTVRIEDGRPVLCDKINGTPVVSGIRGSLVYCIAGGGECEWTDVRQ